MARRIGLRTEIIVNIILLMAAALLFVGFLLLKLSERELLRERVARVTGALELVAATLTPPGDLIAPGSWRSGLPRALPADLAIDTLVLVDLDLRSVYLSSEGREPRLDQGRLDWARRSRETDVVLRYGWAWWPLPDSGEREVLVTVPLLRGGEFAGALQARFPLGDIRDRLYQAQRLVLLYVVLYGLVLVLFGGYLLGRAVVRPIRGLMAATQQIAGGNLEHEVPEGGLLEIAELADSFNRMARALQQSRVQAVEHIETLSRTNRALQEARDELARSERLASVGHLAAGMAHEIGNPLGAIVGYLGILKSELEEPRQAEVAERALAEANRIDRLVRDLLDYAAPDKGDAAPLDPLEVLSEARELLLHQQALCGLTLEERLPVSLPPVRVSRHKLLQVFINLLLNARDATPPGGRLTLSAGEGGGEVWLALSDTGSGMTPEVREHLFDPFFTTKGPGKGRGLGLSVCHRIVEESGGRIEVDSEAGKGTTFTVRLPRAAGGCDGG